MKPISAITVAITLFVMALQPVAAKEKSKKLLSQINIAEIVILLCIFYSYYWFWQ